MSFFFVALERRKSGLRSVAVAGGVGANSYLRSKLEGLEKKGYKVYLPDLKLCTDNGAMIAAEGYYMMQSGKETADLSLNAMPTLKLRGEKPH